MAIVILAGACLSGSGCGQPRRAADTTPRHADDVAAPAEYRAEAQRIEADPVGYLQRLYQRMDALPQYRLRFYRQERFGGRLHKMEEIDALFRRTPFSVKFTWDDPDADYYESIYVVGQNNSKLVVRERKGALPLIPPMTRRLEPEEAVKFGRAKNPVTDFGLARVVQRTLLPLEDPQLRTQTNIRYQGVVMLEPQKRLAHYLKIERPITPEIQYARQDFFLDAQTLLPAGTDLYLPGGDLDARYRYTEVDTNVNLSNADFRLSGGKKK